MNIAMNYKPNELLKQQFFEGRSHAARTVKVVTTNSAAGRAGATVSAMSSVSGQGLGLSLLPIIKSASNTTYDGRGPATVRLDHDASAGRGVLSHTTAGNFS